MYLVDVVVVIIIRIFLPPPPQSSSSSSQRRKNSTRDQYFRNRRATKMLSRDQNFSTADRDQRSVKRADKIPSLRTSEMDCMYLLTAAKYLITFVIKLLPL